MLKGINQSFKKSTLQTNFEEHPTILKDLELKEEFPWTSRYSKFWNCINWQENAGNCNCRFQCSRKMYIVEKWLGSLPLGSSYLLEKFNVCEYASKKLLCKAKEDSDIEFTANNDEILEDDTQKGHHAQFVGVPQLDIYKACLQCKAWVERCYPPLARCSKEGCEMSQRYDVCP